MPQALPANPNLDWLKKTAKQRFADLRAGQPDARLHQAQLTIAHDYGFTSWRALKAHLDGIWGGRDATAYPHLDERARTLRSFQPEARFEVIDGAGHWVQYEAADLFNPLLAEIVEQHRRQSP